MLRPRPNLAFDRALVKPRPIAKAATKVLTIEEARVAYSLGSIELAAAELSEQNRLEAIAKEHSNAVNRQGTKVKNAVKALAIARELKPEDMIQIGDKGYRYDVTHSESIDAEKLYELFVEKKISKDAFLKSISVTKAEASKYIGPHILMTVTKVKDGKTLDIRKEDLETTADVPRIVKGGISTPKPGIKQLSDAPPSSNVAATKPLAIRRRVRIG